MDLMLQLAQNANTPVTIADRGTTEAERAVTYGDPPIMTTGRDLPPHLVQGLAPPRSALSDPVSRSIVQLLRLNPEINADYPYADLRTMSASARKYMLASIRERLGIPACS